MNMDYFRSLYDYHYQVNDKLWESVRQLSDEQFVQDVNYSIGSVRNHVVHVMGVDDRWFKRIKEEPLGDRLVYADFTTPAATYELWKQIETGVVGYVNSLDDVGARPDDHLRHAASRRRPSKHRLANSRARRQPRDRSPRTGSSGAARSGRADLRAGFYALSVGSLSARAILAAVRALLTSSAVLALRDSPSVSSATRAST